MKQEMILGPEKRILPSGSEEYRNEHGDLHRTDGPALILPNGTEFWYFRGLLHRTDGPAASSPSGEKMWCIAGRLHREDGPALIKQDKRVQYWLNGKHVSKARVMGDGASGKRQRK